MVMRKVLLLLFFSVSILTSAQIKLDQGIYEIKAFDTFVGGETTRQFEAPKYSYISVKDDRIDILIGGYLVDILKNDQQPITSEGDMTGYKLYSVMDLGPKEVFFSDSEDLIFCLYIKRNNGYINLFFASKKKM